MQNEHREWRFAWRGIHPDGRTGSGTLIATSEVAARAQLRHLRVAPFSVVRRRAMPQQALRGAEVTAFCRQLAGLLAAGLPLLTALDLIAGSHARRAVAASVRALSADIIAGASFAAALARQARSFDPMLCQLVAIGEASGALNTILAKLADDRQRSAAQQARLRTALTYPAGVLLLALAITAALLIWVVPTFRQVFDSFGAPLPAPTRAVLALSDAFIAAAPAVFAGVLCTACGLRLAVRRSSACRLALDRLWLRLPLAGRLIRQIAALRWSRALGIMLRAGTPLADAFGSLPHATGNLVFDRATEEIAGRLQRGESLATALRACGCFPATVVQPIAVAEQSGALDTMLLDLAALDEARVEAQLGTLASLAEPVIVAVLGALVGALVLAMYLPIIELGNVV